MPQTVGLGVVGLGKIGWLHALNVSGAIRSTRLVAVCDSNPDVLTRATDEFGVAGCSTVQQLAEHTGVEGIVVASTAESHAEAITAAARAGKHVFSEKPVSLGLAETDAALQAIVDAGSDLPDRLSTALGCRIFGGPATDYRGHNRPPAAVQGAWTRSAVPRRLQDPTKSGGIFLDAAMHDYDAGRFLMGAEIIRIGAHGATLLHEHLAPLGDIDTSASVLTFAGGAWASPNGTASPATATMFAPRCMAPKARRRSVRCSEQPSCCSLRPALPMIRCRGSPSGSAMRIGPKSRALHRRFAASSRQHRASKTRERRCTLPCSHESLFRRAELWTCPPLLRSPRTAHRKGSSDAYCRVSVSLCQCARGVGLLERRGDIAQIGRHRQPGRLVDGDRKQQCRMPPLQRVALAQLTTRPTQHALEPYQLLAKLHRRDQRPNGLPNAGNQRVFAYRSLCTGSVGKDGVDTAEHRTCAVVGEILDFPGDTALIG